MVEGPAGVLQSISRMHPTLKLSDKTVIPNRSRGARFIVNSVFCIGFAELRNVIPFGHELPSVGSLRLSILNNE